MRGLAAVLLGCVACGGGAGLDPAFEGTWYGLTTVEVLGLDPFAYRSSMPISVSERGSTLVNVCPDGSGSVFIDGEGSEAEWDGELECPPVPFAGCSSVALIFRGGEMSLSPSNALVVSGWGDADGCGASRAVTIGFTGSKTATSSSR